MICNRCGKQLPDNTVFCPMCGNYFVQNDSSNIVKVQNRKPRKKPKIWIPILIIVLAMIVTGVSVFLLYRESQKGNNAPKQPEQTTKAEVSEPEYNLQEIEKEEVQGEKFGGNDEEFAKAAQKDIADINKAIDKALKDVTKENPTVTNDNIYIYLDAVEQQLYELEENGKIQGYTVNDSNINIDLNCGISYMYSPYIEGTSSPSGGNIPKLKILTFEPCKANFQNRGEEDARFTEYVDEGAELIANIFNAYNFESPAGDYDNQNATLEEITTFANYNVILWDGHGGWDGNKGSCIVTGDQYSFTNIVKYRNELKNGEIGVASIEEGENVFVMYPAFIENHIQEDSLDNTIVYLSTCESGKDDRLAQAFLNKGAEAVYANSDTIHTRYTQRMIYAVCEGLCNTNEEGLCNNVQEALYYAKAKEGEYDSGDGLDDTEVLLFTKEDEEGDFALDWYEDHVSAERDVVLVLDKSGSMEGEPLEQTKEASKKFISTILKEDAVLGVVTYSSSAQTELEFSTRENVLRNKVENMSADGGTNIEDALKVASELLESSNAKKKIIVLMSDGEANEGLEGDDLIHYADTIRNSGVYIYTLGFFESLDISEKTQAQYVMEGIANDGCHYEVTDVNNLVFFFGDIADQINGQKYIYVKIACPVDVKVSHDGETLNSDENHLSDRTSFGTLTFEEERKDSEDDKDYDSYYDEDENETSTENQVKILRLKDGVTYDIEIEGTGRGSMDYSIGFMDDNGEYSDFRKFRNIGITRKTKIDTVANSADITVLNVDEDGDGKYDYIYEANANEKGKLRDTTYTDILKFLIVSCSVLIILMIAYIIIRKKIYNNYIKSIA